MKKITIIYILLAISLISYAQAFPDDTSNQWPEFFENSQNTANRIPAFNDFAVSRTEDYGNPPSWKWAKKFGGDGSDVAFDITEDIDGNYYATGAFSGTIEIDGSTYSSVGISDMFVAKTSTTGELIWFKTFSCRENERLAGSNIKQGPDGFLYVSGSFTGLTDFNTGGDSISSGVTTVSAFLGKMNPDGEFSWYKPYVNYQRFAVYPQKIDIDASGNIYLLVGRNPSQTAPKGTISKFASDGNLLLEINQQIYISDFFLTATDLYLTGSVYNNVTIDNVSFEPTSPIGNAFVAKAGHDLNFEWGHMVENDLSVFSESSGNLITGDDSGNLYFGGIFSNSAIVDGLSSPENISKGVFYSKINSNGNFQWTNFFDTENFTATPYFSTLKPTGHPLIIGSHIRNININGNILKPLNAESSIILTLNMDTGSLLSGKRISQRIFNMYFDSTGKIGVAGTSKGDLHLIQLDPEYTDEWIIKSEGTSGSTSHWYERKVFIDQDKNNYCVSRFRHRMLYEGIQENAYGQGVSIIKTDISGNPLWVNSLESTIYLYYTNANIDKSGNILLCGVFNGKVTSSLGDFATNDYKSFFAKLDAATGDLVLFKILDTNSIAAIGSDDDNNIIITGVFDPTIKIDGIELNSLGSKDYYLAKFTKNGTLIWAKSLGGTGDENDHLSIDSDAVANIYLYFSSFSTSMDLGNGINLSLLPGEGNLVVAKFSPSGTALWGQVLCGTNLSNGIDESCEPYALSVTDAGDIFIDGLMGRDNFIGDFNLVNPYYIPNVGRHVSARFIAKLDTDGAIIWANNISQANYHVKSVQNAVDNKGNFYISGNTRDSLYFSETAILAPEGFAITFVAKYDSTGEISWIKNISNNVNQGGVAVLAENEVIVSGDFFASADIGGIQLSAKSSNGYLASTVNQEILPPEAPASTCILNIYPIPFYDHLTIHYKLAERSVVRFRLFDVQGRVVRRYITGTKEPGEYQEFLEDIIGLPAGVYFLNFIADSENEVQKIEKVR